MERSCSVITIATTIAVPFLLPIRAWQVNAAHENTVFSRTEIAILSAVELARLITLAGLGILANQPAIAASLYSLIGTAEEFLLRGRVVGHQPRI